MIDTPKPIELLTVADLTATPVWQYTNRDRTGETTVRGVKRIPVKKLSGKVIATLICLANGTQAWALIGNIDPLHPRLAEHFLTLSIEHRGKWFHLARYHDFDYADRGPEALSQFLGVAVDEIFPISFDVREYAWGDPASLQGCVRKEPRERLTREEIIALAVP
ncbi:hypothetical protein [uncultured Paludibaculum sp.]|uniref:hypothetical protein n=1 Tax=uncultured Paludibaculum sp. TaxID=1765020 RepID=UPI002AAB8862|nr:hypothetical protein [uncultured Paludibaculum sp.]